MADYIGSTTGIMKYAKESNAKEFIIGTENSIVQHLQYECPDKKFYPLSKDCVCHNMKLTTLMDVYNCVCGQGGEEIKLDGNDAGTTNTSKTINCNFYCQKFPSPINVDFPVRTGPTTPMYISPPVLACISR